MQTAFKTKGEEGRPQGRTQDLPEGRARIVAAIKARWAEVEAREVDGPLQL
jgi:hypothetical protein